MPLYIIYIILIVLIPSCLHLDPPPATLAHEAPSLKALFAAKGFDARELVALSGAHCIGSSQFTQPVVRIYTLANTLRLIEKSQTPDLNLT